MNKSSAQNSNNLSPQGDSYHTAPPTGSGRHSAPIDQLPTTGNPYSRSSGAPSQYSETTRKRRRRRHVLIACLCAVAALLVFGTVGAFAYMGRIQNNLTENVNQDLIDVLDETYVGEPFYMLLLGVDRSQWRENSEEYAGDNFRSDSMILARIDPKKQIVTLVSLHRDTLIDMGEYGKNKLNAAHALGGPALAVEVVSKFAGVPISHYAEIDFDGFSAVVDALGGVEVDVAMEIDDVEAGGHVDAGLQTLDGNEALILCRSRHSYDDYGDGDRYRAANQRLVIGAIADKLLASDPVTIASTVETLSQYVTTTMSIPEIINLAQNFKGMDVENNFYTAMEPTESFYENETWYEEVDKAAWREMMNRVNQGLPPTTEDEIDERNGAILSSTGGSNNASSNANANRNANTAATNTSAPTVMRSGTVTVKNGMGVAGVGDAAANKVKTLGYSATASNAQSFDYAMSVVVYRDPSQAQAAQEIADLLGVDVVTMNENNNYVFEGDFLVLIGADWQSST